MPNPEKSATVTSAVTENPTSPQQDAQLTGSKVDSAPTAPAVLISHSEVSWKVRVASAVFVLAILGFLLLPAWNANVADKVWTIVFGVAGVLLGGFLLLGVLSGVLLAVAWIVGCVCVILRPVAARLGWWWVLEMAGGRTVIEIGQERFVAPPHVYFLTMLAIAWSAFRHPLTTTTIDFCTAKTIRES